jgi:O-antigen/teichoic acid export membrane protein
MAATRITPRHDVDVTVEEPLIEQPHGLRAPGTARMIGGSLIGALCAYLFQVVGSRTLGTEAFSPIAILWTVFFIAATVGLIPLEQFVTREVGRGRRVLIADRSVIAGVTVGTGLVLAVFVYFTRDGLFDGEPIFALQAFLLTVLFGFMQVGKGVLAGHRRFAIYGSVLLLEGLARLAAAVAFLSISPTAVSLGWAMVCAPLGIFLISPWRLDRETVAGVAPTSARGFLSSYAAGASASQLLLAGAPLGVAALGGGEALRSIMFQTFTLYRAPLTLIYNLQGRVLSLLVRHGNREEIRQLARRLLGLGVILVVAAAAVGFVAGPKVVELLYGFEFRPLALVAALAAAGVIAAAVTQLLSQALVAGGSTGELAGAWIGGLVVGLATMLALPGNPDFRVAAGFVAGEIAALAIASWRTLRRP